MKNRNEIPAELKWDFSHMFATPEDWEKAYAECEAAIPTVAAVKGTLGQSAEALFSAYETVYNFSEKFDLVSCYAFGSCTGHAYLEGGQGHQLHRTEQEGHCPS